MGLFKMNVKLWRLFGLYLIAFSFVFIGILSHLGFADVVQHGNNVKLHLNTENNGRDVKKQRISFILLGSTGNLAEKYLWQSLFNIQMEGLPNDEEIYVYPAATKDAKKSEPMLKKILENNITAHPKLKEIFLKQHVGSYVQLKYDEQYQKLAEKIEQDLAKSNAVEVGRIFYLSVPPKFFGSITHNINKYLRPKSNRAFLRVIVEKPFGTDFSSASKLAKTLYEQLDNSKKEILLVDHYMGKVGMKSIRDFMKLNHGMIFSAENKLKEIEVAMLEKDTCENRTAFYDEIGVLRDTMQNHLMMMLAVFAKDHDQEAESEQESRLEFLKTIKPVQVEDINFLGQYKDYALHVLADKVNLGEEGSPELTLIPTYSNIQLSVDETGDSKFANVQITLKSGKALLNRTSYLKASFEDGTIVVFNFQGQNEHLKDLAIGVFKSKDGKSIKFQLPDEQAWKIHVDEIDKKILRYQTPVKEAYEVLLRSGFENNFDDFVNLEEVLESWRIFDNILGSPDSEIKVYEKFMKLYDVGVEYPEKNFIGAKKSKEEL